MPSCTPVRLQAEELINAFQGMQERRSETEAKTKQARGLPTRSGSVLGSLPPQPHLAPSPLLPKPPSAPCSLHRLPGLPRSQPSVTPMERSLRASLSCEHAHRRLRRASWCPASLRGPQRAEAAPGAGAAGDERGFAARDRTGRRPTRPLHRRSLSSATNVGRGQHCALDCFFLPSVSGGVLLAALLFRCAASCASCKRASTSCGWCAPALHAACSMLPPLLLVANRLLRCAAACGGAAVADTPRVQHLRRGVVCGIRPLWRAGEPRSARAAEPRRRQVGVGRGWIGRGDRKAAERARDEGRSSRTGAVAQCDSAVAGLGRAVPSRRCRCRRRS